MLKKILQNWREVVGWLAIGIFIYVYLFEASGYPLHYKKDNSLEFLVVSIILILAWLILNRRKLEK